MPAETNPKVMAMVEDELRKHPGIKSTELFQKAQKVDKSIANLNIRQFHARYPLRVKRQETSSRPRKRRTAPETQHRDGRDRTAVRNVLVKLASDVVAADDKAQLIEVMGHMDRYVDQVLNAASRR